MPRARRTGMMTLEVGMIAEIAVTPQLDGSSRKAIRQVVDDIAATGLTYQVTPTGTCVEGESERILDAVGRVVEGLRARGIERAVIELRLVMEPHPETLPHHIDGLTR